MTSEGWPEARADDWTALVERTLRGRDWSGLTSATRDGVEIRPLYTDGPGRPPALAAAAGPRQPEAGWDIRQHHRVPAASADVLDRLRDEIAQDLAGGVTSLELDIAPSVDADGLDRLLEGVDLAAVPVALAPHADMDAAEALRVAAARRSGDDGSRRSGPSAAAEARGADALLSRPSPGRGALPSAAAGALGPGAARQAGDAGARRGALLSAAAGARGAVAARQAGRLAAGSTFGLDPVGEWARRGRIGDCADAAGWAVQAAASGSSGVGVTAFCVDAVRYADAGATEAEALGWATATGVAYLRALVDAGASVDAAAGLIGFRLVATADVFVTIAALRAARVMWARVVTAGGGSVEAARQCQHAVTAAHMYSRRDPWVNLLRGASAALAAGVAGADAVTVLPFDHASGPADADGALGRRLARNTQLLLLEEAHMARSADPAGGSFYVESLTEELASEGWRILQEIEVSGGIEAAIGEGALAAATEQSWRARLGALRTRSEPLVGVSEFVLLDESAQAGRSDPGAARSEADQGRPAGSEDTEDATGLPIRRLPQSFEDLRDAADRHRAATGDRPAAWVAALGPASDHSARTAWARNLLAAGGIEARGAAGVDSPIAAAADFAASGLTAAVMTGADDMYRLRGAATAGALAEAGAALVALVCDTGTPAEMLSDLQSAGVDEIWHDGVDAVSALEGLHRRLGIARPQSAAGPVP